MTSRRYAAAGDRSTTGRRAHQQRRREPDVLPDLAGRPFKAARRSPASTRRPVAEEVGDPVPRRDPAPGLRAATTPTWRPCSTRAATPWPATTGSGFTSGDCTQRPPGDAGDRAAHHAAARQQPPDARRPARRGDRRRGCSSTARRATPRRKFDAGPPGSAPRTYGVPAVSRQQRHLRSHLVVTPTEPRRPGGHLADDARRSRCRPGARRTCGSSSGGSWTPHARPTARLNYDGGTVEIADDTRGRRPAPARGAGLGQRADATGPTQTSATRAGGRVGLQPATATG